MIYLDHHAASPLNASVRARMDDVGATAWANPSSVHGAGRAARAILERARREVGEAFGVSPKSVVFTSGGTEACNLAIRGLLPVGTRRGVMTTSVEHPAVHEPSQTFTDRRQIPWSESFDVQLPRLATDELLAVQWVNHETGTLFPVARWACQAKRDGARVFVDATQAAGKIPVQFDEIGADALAIASQKIGGPAGVGALLIRGAIAPLLQGGGQERGRRPGTPNVALLAGFGEACCQLSARRASMARITRLRDQLERSLVELGAVLNGVEGPRVGTVVNASFRHLKGEELVAALDLEEVCVSSGAACSSGLQSESPVLKAMYPAEPWRARGALRFSFGPETTDEMISRAVDKLALVLQRFMIQPSQSARAR